MDWPFVRSVRWLTAMSSVQSITLRPATDADAPAIARLSAQLGYPMTIDFVERHLRHTDEAPRHAVIVACRESDVVGWIEVRIAHAMETESLAEIVGLVVDEVARGGGIGRELIAWARTWAEEAGQNRLRVRTNVQRGDAAAFYSRAGFQEIKQQRVFEMQLRSNGECAP